MDFQQTGLMQTLLRAVEASGYEEPTPIQRETIPLVLAKKDVLGCAQTGTGKTAAFALPILQRLWEGGLEARGKRPIRALVLTPTRELALQIFENFQTYGKGLSLRSCVIFGGVNQRPQVEQLNRGVDILVATPGRLNDLIGQGYISLGRLEIFVLDEADRMLDMGFIQDVRKVIALLPAQRQTLLFSATMPQEVEKLAMGILREPVSVKVDPVSSTVDSIRQTLFLVDKANKKDLLAFLLRKPEVVNALVFTRTKHGADRVVRELGKAGIFSKAIHGDKSQNARQEALSEFKDGKIAVLVATDIAARGIDISGLSHVINYDLPNEPEAYVHRIGRTGRAGLEGTAISFCCFDELKDLKAIEKLIGFTIPRVESNWPMEVFTETVKQPRPPRPGRGIQPGQQPSRGQNALVGRGEPNAPRFGPKPLAGNAPRPGRSIQPGQQPSQGQNALVGKGELNAPRFGPKPLAGNASSPTPSLQQGASWRAAGNPPKGQGQNPSRPSTPGKPASAPGQAKRRRRRGGGEALPPQLKGTPLL